MAKLSTIQMVALLAAMGVSLFALAWTLARWRRETAEGFTAAGRQVGLGFGAASLLAGWIWALSLYAPAQAGYQYGIAGPLYYSLGGAMMLMVFQPFVRRVREVVPEGHSIPEYVGARFGSSSRVLTMIVAMLWTVVMLYFNLSAVGYLVSSFSPIPYKAGIAATVVIVVGYSLVAGLKASIITDSVQFAAISAAGLVIAPLVIWRFGGPHALAVGLAQLGDKGDLFSANAFMRMGLPWLILGLLGGFSYQNVWQKAWAIDKRHVAKAYLLAGAGWFPYSMAFGTFGVLALVAGIRSVAPDASDITPVVAAHYLGPGASALFVILVLAAACSTCDSALCAFSTILMTDVIRGYVAPRMTDGALVLCGRIGMVILGIIGAVSAMHKGSLLQLIFLLGAARAALVFPLLSSLYWRRAEGRGYFWGVLGGIVTGIAASLSLRDNPMGSLYGLLVALAVSIGISALFAATNREPFIYSSLSAKVRRFDA